MKLQLALDRVDLSGIMAVLQEVGDLVDIVEIGTPVIIREGVRAVAETKRAFPEMEVLADLKIMDAGEYEASIAFDAGADIVTVLGAAHDATVLGAIRQARARSRRVMVDMIAVEDVPARVRQVDEMGADFVCVHTATDVQGGAHDPLRNLADVAAPARQGLPRRGRRHRAWLPASHHGLSSRHSSRGIVHHPAP